jgi:Blastomyces yeast-phase-specific protein
MLLSLALAALAAAGTAHAQGSAYIYNYCNTPVNLWAVDAERNPQSPSPIANGSSYSEVYQTLASGGVSLKIGFGSSLYDGSAITQFEYTLTGGFIWYDISNVNCQGNACPFAGTGMHLETSDPTCPARTCTAGEVPCSGAYTNYNDDWNSLACGPSSDIKLYLCATGDSAPAPAAPAPAPAAAAPAAVAPPAAASSAASVIKMEAITERGLAAREVHRHMRRHMHSH